MEGNSSAPIRRRSLSPPPLRYPLATASLVRAHSLRPSHHPHHSLSLSLYLFQPPRLLPTLPPVRGVSLYEIVYDIYFSSFTVSVTGRRENSGQVQEQPARPGERRQGECPIMFIYTYMITFIVYTRRSCYKQTKFTFKVTYLHCAAPEFKTVQHAYDAHLYKRSVSKNSISFAHARNSISM